MAEASAAAHQAFTRIGLYARSETRLFMIAVARRLKEQYGAAIVLYAGNAQEIAFYRQRGESVFDQLIEIKTLHAAAMEPTAGEVAEVERARLFEARADQTINCLSVANRHLGRGYSLGGFYHPRSRFSEQTGYVNLLHAYNECLSFWDREIAERRLTLVLNGPREAAVMAHLNGVPYRVLAGSRYRNLCNWAWNEFYENPEVEAAFATDENAEARDALDQPYDSHMINRSRFVTEVAAHRVAKRAAREVARYAWWHLRGYAKARGYYLSQNLGMMYRTWSDWQNLNKLATVTLDDLKGQRFVYYPLHQEPEMALQGLSPEFFYQLSLIAGVARDLPAGVRLAVKETFGAVGRRPRDFYRQIAEFKNVVWLKPLELGLECARRADAVVTICGTGGFEAAVLGRPVVALGRHNVYNFLPHVHVVENESQLRTKLAAALDGEHDAVAAQRTGLRFLRAVMSRSFDMRGYDYINMSSFETASVDQACAALMRGLAVLSQDKPSFRGG